jgi:tetratricopeptide (TPR) repeat protein
LVDKDPEKAIALFWKAINANDRVDSALKDMAIVMKQQGRSEEAIEAIRSLRSKCSEAAQESLDNVLLDLYKVRITGFVLVSCRDAESCSVLASFPL